MPDRPLSPPPPELGPSEKPVDPEAVMRTCPICGAELHERKCKLICSRPGCVYFLSCADYY